MSTFSFFNLRVFKMPFDFKEKKQEECKFLTRIQNMVEKMGGAEAGSPDNQDSMLILNFHLWTEGKIPI